MLFVGDSQGYVNVIDPIKGLIIQKINFFDSLTNSVGIAKDERDLKLF